MLLKSHPFLAFNDFNLNTKNRISTRFINTPSHQKTQHGVTKKLAKKGGSPSKITHISHMSRKMSHHNDMSPWAKQLGRQRPIREILGGGKVADVLLWKDKTVSAAILIGIGILWYLFEFTGYNVLTLLCHTIIFAMVLIFVWDRLSEIFKWAPPRIPRNLTDNSTIREMATLCRAKLEDFLIIFFSVACGQDFGQFLLVIVALWVLSTIGNYISTLNLLFFGCLCLETLPYVYDRYEEEVDYLLSQAIHWLEKTFKKLDEEFLRKIPRGPVKEKKHM